MKHRQFALSLLQDHLPVYTILLRPEVFEFIEKHNLHGAIHKDHDGSHIKGLLNNFMHSEWPFLLKVLSFLVEFITPIIKAANNQSIAVKSFYSLLNYEAWKGQP